MFQLVENQTFQKMKHWRSMFHFWFQCFILVSVFHFWFQCFIFYLPYPLSKKLSGRKIKPQWERFKTSMGEKSNPNGRNTTETLKSKMKHRMPMFHLLKVLIINVLRYENETWNKKRLKVNIMYARVRSASSLASNTSLPAGSASSPGGDAAPRRHCQVGGRCPNLAIRKCIVFACQGIEP